MKPLHVYKAVDVPMTDKIRWVIFDMTPIAVMEGTEIILPKEVWSARAVGFYDHAGVTQTQRQVFDECCRRNGAKPRKATFQESIALMAQLRELDRQGVRV